MNLLFLADERLSKKEFFASAAHFHLTGKNVKLAVYEIAGSCRSLDVFYEDRCLIELLEEVDVIITNTTKLSKTIFEQSRNLLLICGLNNIRDRLDLISAEKRGILVIETQSSAGARSKQQTMELLFSELTRFIAGEPLNMLV